MIRLNLTNEPTWLDLAPGLRLRLAPCSSAVMMAARADVQSKTCPRTPPTKPARWCSPRRSATSPSSTGRASATSTAIRLSQPRGDRSAARSLSGLRALPTRLHRQGPGAGTGKKRLRARAEWHFGGGDGYCAACPTRCAECPERLNQPRRFEGWQVWDIAQRMSGQLRAIPGAVLGWDLTTGLAIAAALGVSPVSCGRTAARDRGGRGAQTQRTDRSEQG